MTSNHHLPAGPNYNSEDLEQDIAKLIPLKRISSAVRHSMPDYVDHHPDVDDVGRLSAEALVMSYEASAKQIEEMGTSLVAGLNDCRHAVTSLAKELELVEQEHLEAVKSCLAAAEVFRAQAKEMFERIQSRAILAAKVRETATNMIDDLK